MLVGHGAVYDGGVSAPHPTATIVIPAHDEERVIAAGIRRLLDGAVDDEFDVLVVANGCTDRTADRAREAGARVVETDAAGKIVALREAERHIAVHPVLYVDADVLVGVDALRALRDALETPAARVAAPRLEIDASRSSVFARAYYRIWRHTGYATEAMIGSGLYAVNAAGHERIADWPDLIADDMFVQDSFAPGERIVPEGAAFTVVAPGTLRAVIRRGWRMTLGNDQFEQFKAQHPERFPVAAHSTGSSVGALVRRVAPHPRLWSSFVVYCAAYASIRGGALWRRLRGDRRWHRDESARSLREH